MEHKIPVKMTKQLAVIPEGFYSNFNTPIAGLKLRSSDLLIWLLIKIYEPQLQK